jgi:OmpA-OmpF porin, OOP family
LLSHFSSSFCVLEQVETSMKFLFLCLALSGGLSAQEMSFTVALADRLSTQTNHKGDAVTARVLQPPQFEGDTVQGHVTEAKSGNKLHGQAVLNFNFESLIHGGQTVPVSCEIASIENSKGQANVDEEGRVIRKSSNVGKAVGGAGLGGLIGGIAGGGKGAAIGAAAGGVAAIVLIEVAAQGPQVDFAPGAHFELLVKARGGPGLSSLKPNRTITAAPAPRPAASAPQAAPAPVAASSPAAAPPAGNAGGQPNLAAAKIDFIPGEKTIFYDDFSDMGSDEPPPHWKVRGNPVELRKGGGIRELYASKGVELTSPNIVVPKNFTFELELTGTGETTWRFRNKDGHDVLNLMVRGEPDQHTANTRVEWSGHGQLGSGEVKTTESTNTTPIKFALWVQEGRLRAYLNGQRLVDVNQVDASGITSVYTTLAGYRPNGLRSVRIAESAPDFSTVISQTGKYVTHGINFDTDSDRLKPESAAVLKAVANGLDKNPNLKLEIDGYTDSTGDAAHNADLSKRRAEAVKTVLTSQYGVDASRLKSSGFGAEKPMASNDTPDGRAQNRRVEFVKQ